MSPNPAATLLEYATPEETVAAVRTGEADAVFADYDYLKPVVDAAGGELAFTGGRVPLGDGVGMGIRESDTELRDKMDAGITAMKEGRHAEHASGEVVRRGRGAILTV